MGFFVKSTSNTLVLAEGDNPLSGRDLTLDVVKFIFYDLDYWGNVLFETTDDGQELGVYPFTNGQVFYRFGGTQTTGPASARRSGKLYAKVAEFTFDGPSQLGTFTLTNYDDEIITSSGALTGTDFADLIAGSGLTFFPSTAAINTGLGGSCSRIVIELNGSPVGDWSMPDSGSIATNSEVGGNLTNSGTFSPSTPKENYPLTFDYVIFNSGQSNSIDYASQSSPVSWSDNTWENVYSYHYWYKTHWPVGHIGTDTIDEVRLFTASTNPRDKALISLILAQDPNATILVVHADRGATGFNGIEDETSGGNVWDPGDELRLKYGNAITDIFSQYVFENFIGIWIQGEANAGQPVIDRTDDIEDLLSEYNLKTGSKFYALVDLLAANTENINTVNGNLAAINSNVSQILTGDLSLLDAFHYDGPSQETIAARVWTEYQTYLSNLGLEISLSGPQFPREQDIIGYRVISSDLEVDLKNYQVEIENGNLIIDVSKLPPNNIYHVSAIEQGINSTGAHVISKILASFKL